MKSADKKCIKPVENNTEKSLSRISKKMTRRLAIQTGQVAIIVGLALTALIGILAYVIDEGSIYEERRSLQSVADSASLAAVQELPEDPSGAVQKAIEYASLHGVSLAAGDVVIGSTFTSNDTATVTAVNPDREMFFAGIFGINSVAVGADATAVVGSPEELNNIVPFGVLEDDWVPGEEYELKWGPPGETGNFGALGLGGSGANNYRNNIKYGYGEPLVVGDVVETEPGNMKGPTLQGTENRIFELPDHKFNSFDELTDYKNGKYVLKDSTDSQFVMCPLINEVPNGRKDVTILAFVPFIITKVTGSKVYGTFIDQALIVTKGGIAAVDEHGIRIIRLMN